MNIDTATSIETDERSPAVTLHLYQIKEIENLLTILDEVFPPERRHLDFPDTAQTLDVSFVLAHGAVCLDEDNLFAYLSSSDTETELVEVMTKISHVEVIEVDDPVLVNVVEKIQEVAKKLSATREHGVLFIKADVHYEGTTFTERLVEMIAPRGWPVDRDVVTTSSDDR